MLLFFSGSAEILSKPCIWRTTGEWKSTPQEFVCRVMANRNEKGSGSATLNAQLLSFGCHVTERSRTRTMSYSNHYNYQVAVIFAILLGGMLLLGLVVGGIYFVCVNNMRDSDKKRLHSGRNSSAAWPAQTPTYSAPYREGPTTAAVLSSPTPAQNFDFAPRSSVLQTPANVSSHYMPQQQYSTQVPLVTPTRVEEFAPGAQYRPLQPDVIYTQGPSGYTQSTPVEYAVQTNLPSYHQSSV